MRNREANGPLSQLYGNNKGNYNVNNNNNVNSNTNTNNYNFSNNQDYDDESSQYFSFDDIKNISINNPNNSQKLVNNPNNFYEQQRQNNNQGAYHSDNIDSTINNIYDRNYVRKEEPKGINYSVNDDYEFINTYVNVNQEKLLFNTKNFAALIFGEYYLFYRKLYVTGALLFFLKLIIALYLHWILAIFINLIPFFLFNKYYVFIIMKRLKKFKKKYPESRIELYNAIEKAGGVSFISILIGIGIEVGVTGLFFILSLMLGFSTVFSNFWSLGPSKKFVEPDDYDGVLVYNEKEKIKSNITVDFPKEVTDKSNEYSYIGEFSKDKTVLFNKCEYTVHIIDNYRDLDNLSELMSDYYDVDYSKRTINGVKWNHIVADKRGMEEIFLAKKGKYIYIYRSKIDMDADVNVCKEYNEKIVSSLKFK